jgi:hypothetical protein
MRLRMLILAAGLLWPVSSFSQGSGEEYFFQDGKCASGKLFWSAKLHLLRSLLLVHRGGGRRSIDG